MKLINTAPAKVPSLAVGSKVKVVFSDAQADCTVAAVVTKVNKVTFEAKLTEGMYAGNVYRINKDDTYEYKLVKA